MVSLFLDTTSSVEIGLLNEGGWIDYRSLPARSGAKDLHISIHELLVKNNFDFSSVKDIFQMAGPGSYTGVRVAEGISQILDWEGLKIYSFYHFEVPLLAGHEAGSFVAEAFKGEYFIYSWKGESSFKELTKSLPEVTSKVELFTNSPKLENKYTTSTLSLLKNNHWDIFYKVKELDLRREPFYFRPEDKEFKPSVK